MDTTELAAWTREEATLSVNSTDYNQTKLIQLMNQTMSTVIEPIIANARSGYWCHTFTRTLGANNAIVRLPPRATPAIEQADISTDGGATWAPLSLALESEIEEWANDYRASLYPVAYYIRSSYVHLIPAAKVDTVQLRVKTLVKPSQLVAAQAAGRITAFDYDTRIATVNALPVNAITSATLATNDIVDVVEPRANFELATLDAVVTVVDPTHVQFSPAYSTSKIEVGDYIRHANQSEWPQLPETFHSIIGSITAVPICRQRDLLERASTLADVGGVNLQRLDGHLRPRVRTQDHKPQKHNWSY